MSQDSIFEGFSAVLFALGIFVVTYVTRTVIQYFWKDWKKSLFYNELVLHLLPIVLGGALSMLKNFPWPNVIANSRSGRLFFGMTLGMFCGLIYSRVHGFAKASTDFKILNELPKTEDVVSELPKTEDVFGPVETDERKTPAYPPK